MSALAGTHAANAVVLNWDANGAGADVVDGAGTWLTAGNWWNGTANQNWADSNDAVFGGTSGTPGNVNIGASVTVNSITFNKPGYNIIDLPSGSAQLKVGVGGIIVNEDATITHPQGARLHTSNQTWTVAPGKTFNMDCSTGASRFTVGANGTFARALIIDGGGTVNFKSAPTNLGVNITLDDSLEVRAGVVTMTRRVDGATPGTGDQFALNVAGGGTFIQTGGVTDLGVGILHTQGAGTVASPYGKVFLNGGTVITSRVDGLGQLFFNSGKVQISKSGNFLPAPGDNGEGQPFGINDTFISAGGAVIDTAGFDADVNQPLKEDTASTGGALTKQGAGVLNVNRANTYTGITTVSGGTLTAALQASLYNGNTAAWTTTNLVVEPGAELALGVGGAGSFTAGDVDTIKALATATGGYKNGSRLGIDTSAGDFTYGSVISNQNSGANVIGFAKRGANSLTLTAANTYTGGTTVAGGTLVAAIPDAIGAGNALTVGAGATLRSQAGQLTALDVGATTVDATGRIDINDGGLVKRNGGTGAAGAAATLQLFALAKLGLENGGAFDWQGPGISSTEAFNDNTTAGSVLYGIGIIQNNFASALTGDGTTLNAAPGNEIYTTFKGRTVGLNDTLVRYTYMGDADLDGEITGTDYTLIDNGYAFDLSGWINGDYDYSGEIDGTDYTLIDNAYAFQVGVLSEQFQAVYAQHAALFGQSYIDGFAALQAGGGALPEPTALGVLALGGVGLLARRRRR